MIIKLTVAQIELLVDKLGAEIKYQHRNNLCQYQLGKDVSSSDAEVVALLGLCYQLKNILLVEQSKQTQTRQSMQYLTERQDMLFEYMLVTADTELISAIESIQNKLQNLADSVHLSTTIDIEIEDAVAQLLKSKNLIN